MLCCCCCCCSGVVKHVLHLRVFITTTIISLWAYVWMLVVYLWWTPSEVREGGREGGKGAAAAGCRVVCVVTPSSFAKASDATCCTTGSSDSKVWNEQGLVAVCRSQTSTGSCVWVLN